MTSALNARDYLVFASDKYNGMASPGTQPGQAKIPRMKRIWRVNAQVR
jgi:hypothetical protein